MFRRRLIQKLRDLAPMGLSFTAGFFCAVVLLLGSVASASNIDKAYRNLRVFGQVLSYVQQSYVDDVDETTLIYNAINGLLSDLDPYTTFLRPGEYRKLQEDTSGEFGGIGIHIRLDAKEIIIEAVVEGGPADVASLVSGDRIRSIDGERLVDPFLPNVVEKLRGVPGTKVTLGVMREGWEKEREIVLARRHVRVSSVNHSLIERDGKKTVIKIQIKSFQERTGHEVAQVISTVTQNKRASGGIGGIILDLRDNPGGLFDQGVMVADLFLKEGDIVRTMGRNPNNVEQQRARSAGTHSDIPLVLLINEGTASASEIVAGALQDQKRATVIGTNSYGKGSVQTLFGLDDGAGLKLTVARYYTPSGRSIQEKAIEPDIFIHRSDAADGSRHGATEAEYIDKALKILDKESVPRN